MKTYYDEISAIAGNVVTVKAQGIGYDELAVITASHGSSLAQVIRIEDDQVSLQIFGGTEGISTGDKIRFMGQSFKVQFGDALLGRVFDGSGSPRDGRPEVKAEAVEIGSPAVNPIKRKVPNKMIHTRIPMIDIFNTLVGSQKLPIFSVAGEPYNDVLARVGMQADAEIIILGGMG
ncbi:MAG: V-type ATP synthase subunit B, partial [Planctomycetota bacterium]